MKKLTIPLILMAATTACTNHHSPHAQRDYYSPNNYPYSSPYGYPNASSYGYPPYPGSSYSAPSYEYRHEEHKSHAAPSVPAPIALPAPINLPEPAPVLSPADSQMILDAVRNTQQNQAQHEDRSRRERENYNFMLQQNH